MDDILRDRFEARTEELHRQYRACLISKATLLNEIEGLQEEIHDEIRRNEDEMS